MYAWHVLHMDVSTGCAYHSSTHARRTLNHSCLITRVPSPFSRPRVGVPVSPHIMGCGAANSTCGFLSGADSTDRGVTLGVGRGAIDSLLLAFDGAMVVER